jgi:oligoribonuclease (3'-5' exoribonuclease)
MKYLSFDLEATGLEEDCLIIEFGCVPFDAAEPNLDKAIASDLKLHFYVKCPSFDEIKDSLNPWVVENNETLIRTAHETGLTQEQFKKTLEDYLDSKEIKEYFNGEQIVLFGKSMSAIDLPFMNRDLGWQWMRDHFHFRNLDLSAYTYGLIDMGLLPKGSDSGSVLMKYLDMGDVCHTAYEDAVNTAVMYLKLLKETTTKS